jgi:hypothetical protein
MAEQRAAAAERNKNAATPERQWWEAQGNEEVPASPTPVVDAFVAEQRAAAAERGNNPAPAERPTGAEGETLPPEHVPETRAETLDRLGRLVHELDGDVEEKNTTGARGIFGNLTPNEKRETPAATPESGASGEKMKEYLNNRNGELDGEAKEKFGTKAEKLFHSIGEKYNKLNWKYKLAIGVALGVGAGISAGISAPIAAVFGSAAMLQRVAGMAGMYVRFDTHLEKTAKGEGGGLGKYEWYKKLFENKSEAQRKKIAFAMAGATFVGMSAAVGAIAGETSHILATHGWLGHQLGHSSNTAPGAAGHEGVQPSGSTPEAPQFSVDASHGHGYEFMAKRLYEQMHRDPNFKLPPNADPNSDVYRLFHADAHSIDGVVHRIAMDKNHGFFNAADRTSAMINPHDHMTIGADGQIHLDGNVHAPANIHMMHTGPHEAPAAPHAEAPASTTEAPTPPIKPPPPHPVAPHQQPVPENESVTAARNYSAIHTPAEHTPATHTPAGPHAPVGAEHAAHQPAILHHNGIAIPTAESHIYADSHKHLLVYGGSEEQQMKTIQNYLSTHRDQIVYKAEVAVHPNKRVPCRVPFGWGPRPDGSIGATPMGLPPKTHGFLHLGFFKKEIPAPNPKEFHKIIN